VSLAPPSPEADAARTSSARRAPSPSRPVSVSASAAASPASSRRKSTTVMLSRPPPSFAASTSAWAAARRELDVRRISATWGSEIIPVRPSEQMR
jgi:hypothetical protein